MLSWANLALLLCLWCSSSAAEEWRTADKVLLWGALGTLAIDWGQTRDVAKSRVSYPAYACVTTTPIASTTCAPPAGPRTYQERNPILGKEPSVKEVDRYFAAAMLGTAGLAYVMPTTTRRVFLGAVVVVETVVIIQNHSAGIRVSF